MYALVSFVVDIIALIVNFVETDTLPKSTLPPLHRNAFSSSSSLADNDDTQDLQAAIKEAKRLRDLEDSAAPAGGGSSNAPIPPPGLFPFLITAI